MRRMPLFITCLSFVALITTGCLPTQTIIVKFADLRSDIFALESSLSGNDDWAKFDWSTMTITISSRPAPTSVRPVALGAFQVAAAGAPSDADATARPDLRAIETSETVVRVMQRRQGRITRVNDSLKREVAGEANNGILKQPNGTSGFEDFAFEFPAAEDGPVLNDENVDRRTLFVEIVRQKGYRMEDVAKEFAYVRHTMAASGTWIQGPNNSWMKKP